MFEQMDSIRSNSLVHKQLFSQYLVAKHNQNRKKNRQGKPGVGKWRFVFQSGGKSGMILHVHKRGEALRPMEVGNMLTGTFQRTLDSKMRVTLPSTFRREMEDQVCLIPVSGALYGFTPDGFKAWVDSMFERDGKHYDQRNPNDVRLKRGLTSHCQTIDVDSAGRLALGKLGPKVLGKLGFDHDITVLGADDHFEIWDAKNWEVEEDSFDDDLDSLMFG